MAYFGQRWVNIRELEIGRFKRCFTSENGNFRGYAPGGGRTHNLWLRRPTLYPVELRAQ